MEETTLPQDAKQKAEILRDCIIECQTLLLLAVEDLGMICCHLREAMQDIGGGNMAGSRMGLDDAMEASALVETGMNRMQTLIARLP